MEEGAAAPAWDALVGVPVPAPAALRAAAAAAAAVAVGRPTFCSAALAVELARAALARSAGRAQQGTEGVAHHAENVRVKPRADRPQALARGLGKGLPQGPQKPEEEGEDCGDGYTHWANADDRHGHAREVVG
eukprot:CAMPEP_0185211266 /NCGR_PEP_ID=MMETSP1140-20130426/66935_1 /TAXON_ID=298111 /ORGANISM="Pavlova sp., Strain CCMP459" /LENGTH=132 /DNA_ID=CAMNT_0027779105 /DNA_START=1138 /DNA_END=1531 /DNA_ORIENTATION=-